MHIVHVFIQVKADCIDAFKAATIENASASLQEAGITQFDLLQQQDDPTRFVLVEVYKTPADADLHKATAHYPKWRDTVADMMAEPRSGIKYTKLYPEG